VLEVGLARTVYTQGWPEPYLFTPCMLGDNPVKNTVRIPYLYGSGQPCVYLTPMIVCIKLLYVSISPCRLSLCAEYVCTVQFVVCVQCVYCLRLVLADSCYKRGTGELSLGELLRVEPCQML
jgi:hypothetical protein